MVPFSILGKTLLRSLKQDQFSTCIEKYGSKRPSEEERKKEERAASEEDGEKGERRDDKGRDDGGESRE